MKCGRAADRNTQRRRELRQVGGGGGGGGGGVQFRKGLSKTFLLRSSFGYPRGSISFYISLKMNLGGNYRKISVLGSSV